MRPAVAVVGEDGRAACPVDARLVLVPHERRLYDKGVNSPDIEPRRDLGLAHATSLVVGVIIGTGIFLKAASMAQAVGTPWLVLAAWVAAGGVAMLGALCFAELGALLPK